MRTILFFTLVVSVYAETRRLDLKSAAALAETQHPQVALARLETLLARQDEVRARSAYLPQINALAEGTYQTTNLQGLGLVFPGFSSRVGPFRTFNLRPQATQTILDLSLLDTIRATKFGSEQRRWNEETAKEAIRLAAVQLYLQVFEARARISAAEARIAGSKAILEQTKTRESLGGASKLDVARQQERHEAELYAKTLAERDERVILTSLKVALGLTQEDELELKAPVLLPPASEAAQVRSEQKALDAQTRQAELQLRAAQRERLPKLSGFGDFGVFGTGPEQSVSTYQIGARVTVPLWTSGRLEADIAKARLAVERSKTERRRQDLLVAQEIAAARKDYESAVSSIAALERQMEAAWESLELTRLRVESGLATSTDTTTAQANVSETEEALIRTRYTQQIALARWARAHGDLDSVLP
jgi:outer membrane protein